jgi:hypothetical protein
MIRDPRFHRRSDAERLVYAAEIVVHEMKRNGMAKIVYFLRESVGQPRETAHFHSHGQVLAFNITR